MSKTIANSLEEKFRYVNECRKSGLTDYQWCEQFGIHKSTLYHWIRDLKSANYQVPSHNLPQTPVSSVNEVVRIAAMPEIAPAFSPVEIPHVISCQENLIPSFDSVAQIGFGNCTVSLSNRAECRLIRNIIEALGAGV